jgi:hypothetical protein
MPSKRLVKVLELFLFMCTVVGFSVIVGWGYMSATDLYLDACRMVEKKILKR